MTDRASRNMTGRKFIFGIGMYSYSDESDESSEESFDEVEISSSSYQGLSSRSQIRKSSKELKSINRQGFAFISMEGNCCWMIREKRNGRGSNEILIPSFIRYEPGWTIRSFELLDTCERHK